MHVPGTSRMLQHWPRLSDCQCWCMLNTALPGLEVSFERAQLAKSHNCQWSSSKPAASLDVNATFMLCGAKQPVQAVARHNQHFPAQQMAKWRCVVRSAHSCCT